MFYSSFSENKKKYNRGYENNQNEENYIKTEFRLTFLELKENNF